jgi:hypothetical protein
MADPRVELAGLTTGSDAQDALAAFDRLKVVLSLGPDRPRDRSDAVGLLNLVNLGARLFPHWEFRVPPKLRVEVGCFEAGDLHELLADAASRVRTVATAEPAEEFELCWGATPEGQGLAIDAAGWSCSVGPEHLPLRPAPGPPIGALAAGCWAVGQLLVHVLASLGMPGHVTQGFRWNLLDYQASEQSMTAPSDEAPLNLPPFTAAGCGSVGSSIVYGALLIGAAGGPVDLVDPDSFSERNQLRYPILDASLDGIAKSDWLAQRCRGAGIDARSFDTDVKRYTNSFAQPPGIDLLIVSTDTLAGRRDATDVLAETTVNLGVAGLKLHASRHAFGTEGCAYCQYVDVAPPLSGAQVIAQLVGLSVERVVAIECGDGRLSEDDAAAIAASEKFADDPPAAGSRLADLRRRAYAQASIPTADGDLLVSAPHVSAMAGLLGLAEALKASTPALAPFRLAGRVDLDMSGEPLGFVALAPRDKSGRCLCHHGFRRAAWHELRR